MLDYLGRFRSIRVKQWRTTIILQILALAIATAFPSIRKLELRLIWCKMLRVPLRKLAFKKTGIVPFLPHMVLPKKDRTCPTNPVTGTFFPLNKTPYTKCQLRRQTNQALSFVYYSKPRSNMWPYSSLLSHDRVQPHSNWYCHKQDTEAVGRNQDCQGCPKESQRY